MRKLIFNILAHFFTNTLVIALPNMWNNVLENNYHVYDTYYDTLWEYFLSQLNHLGYPYTVLFYTVVILIPFQLIKDFFYKIKKAKLSLLYKCLILTVMSVLFYTILASLYTNEFPVSFFITAIPIGIINALFLYFFIDRYTEKNNNMPK